MGQRGSIHAYSWGTLVFIMAGLLLAAAPIARCSASKADSETVKLLKQWDGDDEATLATLFATGQSRELELAQICHDGDQYLRGEAYVVLLLIGSSETAGCVENLDLEGKPAVLATRDELQMQDFERIERVLTENPCQGKQNCNGEDDCPLIDESTTYALFLNGSARALALLKHMATLSKACRGEDLTPADIALNVDSMNDVASRTRNLQLDTANFESVMKKSAFFVPEDQQKAVSVELLARNETNSRMLVEVSYRCGMLCGSGYYVVLKKNAAGTWDYVLVSRAWIS
jgi:hypothetical protein